MRVIRAAATTLRLYLMRRRQFDNLKLRAYFRKHLFSFTLRSAMNQTI